MSSEPFRLRLPIVDRLEPKECHVVLRVRGRDEMIRCIMKIREQLTVRDVVMSREMGFRPDHPIATPMWFAEIRVLTDVNETEKTALYHADAFMSWRVYEGKRKARIITG